MWTFAWPKIDAQLLNSRISMATKDRLNNSDFIFINKTDNRYSLNVHIAYRSAQKSESNKYIAIFFFIIAKQRRRETFLCSYLQKTQRFINAVVTRPHGFSSKWNIFISVFESLALKARKKTHIERATYLSEYICHFFTIVRPLFSTWTIRCAIFSRYITKTIQVWINYYTHTGTTRSHIHQRQHWANRSAQQNKKKTNNFCEKKKKNKKQELFKSRNSTNPATNTRTTAIFVESRMYWHACVHSTMKWKVNERKSQMS